ncbi:Homeobox protein HD-10 [Leucoagaricus sp. SymC.cos]|nr:Homeobox protein HD-10 [Leucoagaricus sp. SymC.cos]
MSGSSKEQYYTTGSVGKSRRGSPGETNSVFFQGQVPSTYTTQYTQPRSSPGRLYLNPSAFYGQWPTGNNSPPLPEASFAPNYDLQQDRYNTHSYPAYPSARTSPPISHNPTDSRRLPPLSTSAAGGDRWQQGPYQISSNYTTTSIRSPTASYPSSYGTYSNNYTYLPATADQLDMNASLFDLEPQVRSSSPGSYRSQSLADNFTPSPISPNPTPTTEEPTIKKKRKRADANQLKVLNEVYARTAFPSTEERNALAKQLDMSPRSVQIWFQNKRQSMRQTNRQSNSSSLSQQSYSMTSSGAATHNSSRPHGPVGPTSDAAYITSQDHGGAQLQSSSPHRRPEDSMPPPKWTSRGF